MCKRTWSYGTVQHILPDEASEQTILPCFKSPNSKTEQYIKCIYVNRVRNYSRLHIRQSRRPTAVVINLHIG